MPSGYFRDWLDHAVGSFSKNRRRSNFKAEALKKAQEITEVTEPRYETARRISETFLAPHWAVSLGT